MSESEKGFAAAYRLRDLPTERAGAVCGGAVGYVTVLALDLFVGAETSPFAGLPTGGRVSDWLELLGGLFVFGAFAGALCGLIGGRLALWFRRRRAAAWGDFRTAVVGGYLSATLAATLFHLP